MIMTWRPTMITKMNNGPVLDASSSPSPPTPD